MMYIFFSEPFYLPLQKSKAAWRERERERERGKEHLFALGRGDQAT